MVLGCSGRATSYMAIPCHSTLEGEAQRHGREGGSIRDPQAQSPTHRRAGRSRCTRAHRASPSAQEEDRSVTWTPGYPAVCSWHQRSSSSWEPAAPRKRRLHLYPGHPSPQREPSCWLRGLLGSQKQGPTPTEPQPNNVSSTSFIPIFSLEKKIFWRNKVKSLLATERPAGCELRGKGSPEAKRRGRFGVCQMGRGRIAGNSVARLPSSVPAVVKVLSTPHWLLNGCCQAPAALCSPGRPPISPRPQPSRAPAPCSLPPAAATAVGACTSLFGQCFRRGPGGGLLTSGWLSRVCLVTHLLYRLLGLHVVQVSYLRQPLSGLQAG